jgi:flavin-dependent dehydrogenase
METIPANCDFETASAVTWDALVVGAGPAGSLAARQLAAAGARTLLVDIKTFPRAKVCGACLNGHALSVLEAVGLDRLAIGLGAIPLEELQLHLAGRTARLPLPSGAVLSRTRLDAALVQAAQQAGARFLSGTAALVAGVEGDGRAVELVQPGRRTTAHARVVLVAAGLGHPWKRDESLASTRVAVDARVGAGCVLTEFPDDYRERTVFMAVGRRGYVGLVRLEDGTLNVAAALDREFLRSYGRLAQAVAEVMHEAGIRVPEALHEADWHGTAGLTRATRPLGAERLFLLGDATGYVEPFTGEGMAWALTSAQAVAPLALHGVAQWDGSLSRSWSALHHRLIGRRQQLCRGLAILLRHPRLDRLVFELVARAPGMARMMIDRVNAPSAALQECSS